ncbi:enoyl-CoA hydratase family protein [Govanella unica]|uniref:Enoyl-CoA hydratase family protein n=1 Tax=Govanella unica TaxID=2975056 RepID=A0A9X3TXX7_9PROT|nr:enoyl-CoA hydratase family protein [Govania unica]MDA5194000.1 enoyl-CoA hydratase family protein [Govania unica]
MENFDVSDMAAAQDYAPKHFLWEVTDGVALLTLNRPERKNPITFQSYGEMRDLFRALVYRDDIKAVVITGAEGNFSSGGDVHDIIGPLTKMDMKQLLRFTRMTGDLVKAIRNCPQPVIAAIDGICAGAGAAISMAADMRLGTADSKTAFLFTRVGLAGCDMGACTILPRIIGVGRASELLFTGRAMGGEEAERWGWLNRLVAKDTLLADALKLARQLADGPNFGHSMTKTAINHQWSMSLEMAIEAEAQAQAICMQTQDFTRAYNAFVAKEKPKFEGN